VNYTPAHNEKKQMKTGQKIMPPGLKSKHFSGWTTLAGTMLAYAAICGNVTYAFGVFLPPMSEHFGWSRSALSGPYTLYLVVGGLLGPVAGFTVARFGARINIVMGNVMAAVGLLGVSQSGEIWQMYLFFGLLGGLGLAFSEFLPLTTVINHWFIHRRSMALGFLFASGGLAGLVMPPLISSLISGIGWRTAWVVLAGLHLVLGVVFAGLLIRNNPEEEGQVPDGQANSEQRALPGTPAPKLVYCTKEDWRLRDAVGTPALWIIWILFAAFLFTTMMLITHQVAYLQDLQYSPSAAAAALGLMLGMSILGRILSGFLGTRFEGRYLAAAFMASLGLGIISLLNANKTVCTYLYSILSGIGVGGMIVLLPNVLSAYFGRKHFAQIVGWTIPVVTLVSAVSPMLAGFFYDKAGSYLLPFAATAAFLLACSFLALLIRPPFMKKGEQQQSDTRHR